jgi:hypothetical protein
MTAMEAISTRGAHSTKGSNGHKALIGAGLDAALVCSAVFGQVQSFPRARLYSFRRCKAAVAQGKPSVSSRPVAVGQPPQTAR